MKIARKLRHASQTTIFSSVRSTISGLINGHGSAPGNCIKTMRWATPICGAAMARPYPVLFRQCASVSARSRTTAATSADFGSPTPAQISRNPGSPSCKKVRTLINLYFRHLTKSPLDCPGTYRETPLPPRLQPLRPVPILTQETEVPTASPARSPHRQPTRHHRQRSPNHPVLQTQEPALQSHQQLYLPFPCSALCPLEAKPPSRERPQRPLH